MKSKQVKKTPIKYNGLPALDGMVTSELAKHEKEMKEHGFTLQVDDHVFTLAMDIEWSKGDILAITEFFHYDMSTLTLPARHQLNTLLETAQQIADYDKENLAYYLEEDMETLQIYHYQLKNIAGSYAYDLANLDEDIRAKYEKGLVGLYNLETRLMNRIAEQLKDTLPSLRKED